jgi:hypothetical protein
MPNTKPDADAIAALIRQELLGLNSWDVSDLNFPDAKVFKASRMLRPEDRPKRPVKIVQPGEPLADSGVRNPKTGKPIPLRLSRDAGAMVHDLLPYVAVNPESGEYRDDDLRPLASALAHEQQHVAGKGEADAYKRQLEVLRLLGVTDKRMINHVERQIRKFGNEN